MSIAKLSKVVLRSLVGKSKCRMYPVQTREPYAATRGHIEINVDTCTLCTLCAKKCPTQAIAVDRAGRIWGIDRLRCIQCGECVTACMKKSLTMRNTYSAPVAAKGKQQFTVPAPAPKPAAPAADAKPA